MKKMIWRREKGEHDFASGDVGTEEGKVEEDEEDEVEQNSTSGKQYE